MQINKVHKIYVVVYGELLYKVVTYTGTNGHIKEILIDV
jgi:hypothetical protein